MFTNLFIAKLKINEQPQFKLAQKVGLNPTLLSKWVSGYQDPPKNDERIFKLAALIGVPRDKIFFEKQE